VKLIIERTVGPLVEEKRAVIETQLKEQLYNWPADRRPRIIGKFDERASALHTFAAPPPRAEQRKPQPIAPVVAVEPNVE